MAKKRAKRVKKMTVPVSIAAPVGWAAYRFLEPAVHGNWTLAVTQATGYDFVRNKINKGALLDTYAPVLIGAIVHKAAGYLGVNRALANMGVPIIRV